MSKEEIKYRAEFLWGFEDDTIEALGYEFANGKTEPYLKEVWDALVEKIAETEAIGFSDWCADNFKKLHSVWYPYNHYTTKCEDRNYSTFEIFTLYQQSKEK